MDIKFENDFIDYICWKLFKSYMNTYEPHSRNYHEIDWYYKYNSFNVNVINDVGDTFDYDSYMFGYYMEQKNLDAFLFDSSSMYLDTPDYDEYKSIPKDFTVLDIHR